MTAIKKVVDNTHPWNAGDTWNHAYIYGEASTEFDDLMNRPAPLIERHWGQDNPKTRGWRAKSKTWGEWLGDSLTYHRESDRKGGAGYVFGASANGERKAENMRGMVAIGLDVEPEQPLDDVIDICEASGLAIVLYTSHNFDRTSDTAPVDTILKHGDDVTTDTIRAYLRSKNAYSESFIEECELTNPRDDVDGKIQCVWSCPPLQKMRVIVPFERPVDVTALDTSPKKGQGIWASKVRGLADMLRLRIDPVATDPSRILYLAKHRPNTEWYCAVFRGRPVQWEEIPEMQKGADNPFLQAGGVKSGSTIPDVITSTGVDVTALYRRYGKRWLLADMLENTDAAKQQASNGLHVECPFSDSHTTESAVSSTTAWNAPDTEQGFAKVLCLHSCKDRYHTVDYIAQWIEDDVIDPDWLEDPAFMVDAPDQPGRFEELTSDEIAEQRVQEAEQAADFEAQAAAFDYDTASETDVESFIDEAYAAGIEDAAMRERISQNLSNSTPLRIQQVRDMWVKLDRAARADARQQLAEARRNSTPAPYIPLEDATTETVERAAETAGWLPSFVTYKGGWFYAPDFEKPEAQPMRLCRAFEVPHVAFGETEEGRINEITIRYRHRSAQRGIVESVYSIGDAFRDSGSLISRLADDGLEIDAMAKIPVLVALLKSVQTDNEAVLVQKAGWYGGTYVSPTGRVVNAGATRYILDPKARVSGETKGTLADHFGYATTALTGVNGKYFMPGYLSGLVGMVVDFIENDVSPILAHEGDGGRGKTSAGKAGAAHHAPPDSTGLFNKADATPAFVETKAEQSNGSVRVMDEEGASKLDAAEKQRVLMQWAEGMGRGRATADGGTRRTRTWRTCFVTTAERDMLRVFEAAGVDTKTGTIARTFSVNFTNAAELDPHSDELAAIKALSGDDKAPAVYGVTAPVFAEALAKLGRETVKARVSAIMDDWADLAVGSSARRVVRFAAIFAVTGEIAQDASLFSADVPVLNYMRELLEDNMDARMVHLDTDRQQLEALRSAIRRGIQTGSIVSMHEDREFNRQEVFGYYGHLSENGQPDDSAARKQQDPETEMRIRSYVLPVDRLGPLGITTDPKALANRLRDVGGLIERKKGERKQWFHDYVPGEGRGKNIRVSGEFVHG
ncbi:DUF927 domain-containing protein [Ruegeria sp. HKCCE3926]|uniref:DUF927 domain-containing protein n=1 Tax=Ruegeria sp. HKCCE3926 TaxID=2794831 RepID=UPI001AE8A1A0|nr:DUF927 domain-containing protein [Ruegeria sp. HKCCE3926]